MKLGSFNCRGLSSNTVKRRDVFNWIRKKGLDICVLLETHSNDSIHTKWKLEWDGQAWFSSYKSNSRGVAILLDDKNGRYVLLDITLQDKRFFIGWCIWSKRG
jgi:exonuclease III